MRRKGGDVAYVLACLDLDDAAATAHCIPLGFLAHGLTIDPRNPGRACVFEKQGPGGCVVDLGAARALAPLPLGEGRHFYGHGAFAADGQLLYAVESALDQDKRGYITVRDTVGFEVVGEFPSHGRAPHDCVLIDGGATLVITNGGGAGTPGNVAYVDVATQKLQEQVNIPNTQLNAGHLWASDARDLVVVSAPRDGLDPDENPGGVSLRAAGGPLVTASEPRRVTREMLGETLSVAVHPPSRVAAVTNPTADLLTFWNIDEARHVLTMRVPNPRGVALSLDGREFILNFGDPPRSARIDARALRLVDTPENRSGRLTFASGSHIFLHRSDILGGSGGA